MRQTDAVRKWISGGDFRAKGSRYSSGESPGLRSSYFLAHKQDIARGETDGTETYQAGDMRPDDKNALAQTQRILQPIWLNAFSYNAEGPYQRHQQNGGRFLEQYVRGNPRYHPL